MNWYSQLWATDAHLGIIRVQIGNGAVDMEATLQEEIKG
jgi:hypothetical protein